MNKPRSCAHGLLMTGPLVVKTLNGDKTETRRLITAEWARCLDLDDPVDRRRAVEMCPFGKVGSLLYVRETWAPHPLDECDPPERVLYRADGANYHMGKKGPPQLDGEGGRDTHGAWVPKRWRPSMHMPRWAARLWLQLDHVAVERLQDIDETGACAEGFGSPITRDCKVPKFRAAWDAIYGVRGPWISNPFVFRLRYHVVERPDDEKDH